MPAQYHSIWPYRPRNIGKPSASATIRSRYGFASARIATRRAAAAGPVSDLPEQSLRKAGESRHVAPTNALRMLGANPRTASGTSVMA